MSGPRDLRVESAGDPEIAIGSCGDGTRSIYPGEFGDDSLRGDAGKFVHCLLGEPHVPIGASSNVARKGVGGGCSESREPAARQLITPDGMIGLVGKPDIAIGPGGDAHADAEKRKLIFCDDSIRRDRSNFARRTFAEPDVAVWPRRDERRIAQAWGPKVTDDAARGDAGA